MRNSWETLVSIGLAIALIMSGIFGAYFFTDWSSGGLYFPPPMPRPLPESLAYWASTYDAWIITLKKVYLIMAIAFGYGFLMHALVWIREIHRKGHTIHISLKKYKRLLEQTEEGERSLQRVVALEKEVAGLKKEKEKLQGEINALYKELPEKTIQNLFHTAIEARKQLPSPTRQEKDVTPPSAVVATVEQKPQGQDTPGEFQEEPKTEELVHFLAESAPKNAPEPPPEPKKGWKGLWARLKEANDYMTPQAPQQPPRTK